MVIYLVTNKINGKKYVGQTIRPLSERWKDHCRAKDKNYFHNAIRKYGADNFTREVIDTAETVEELDEKEIYWIAKLNTLFPNGYNLKEGGNVSMRGRLGINNPKSRVVYQFRLNGEIVNAYYGASDGERKTGISSSAILRSLKNPRWLAGGYIWVYADDFMRDIQLPAKIVDSYSPKNKKRVVCVETGDEFDSVKEAAEKYGVYCTSISSCCTGKLKTTGGYHWKHID